MPTVTINSPGYHELVLVSQPVVVTGTAAGTGGAEPSAVKTVMVGVPGTAGVRATLTFVPSHPPAAPTVSFRASILLPDTIGAQDVLVTATDDRELTGSASVTVIGYEAGLPVFTPLECMQVSATNPAAPSAGDWATDIVKEYRSAAANLPTLVSAAVWAERGDQFPVCSREWTQVTAPLEDYDDESVAFSGWLLQPELSGNDVPFTHPFGFDWECMVALDPGYTGLLAAGNTVDDGASGYTAREDAARLNIPVPDGGLLAVETDSGCVPSAFRPQLAGGAAQVGDRIAVLGRWIVDTGHSVTVPSGTTSYRAEVHPPMLMAIGGIRPEPPGEPVTRIMLTSRPYLVKQVFTTDTSTIYNDSSADDGTLLWHLNNEIQKLHSPVIPSSTTIEAHPKIASKPFSGVHFLRLRVRPPASAHPTAVPPIGLLQVSFQFTCRSGVGVQVLAADDGVDLLVDLNSVSYVPPALPQRQTNTVSGDQLGDASDLITLEEIASLFELNLIDTVVSEHALAHGIDTDSYTLADVDVLDRSHMVPFVDVNQIPGGQGIVVNDEQPYPIFGFLEIRRHRPGVVLADTGSEVTHTRPGQLHQPGGSP